MEQILEFTTITTNKQIDNSNNSSNNKNVENSINNVDSNKINKSIKDDEFDISSVIVKPEGDNNGTGNDSEEMKQLKKKQKQLENQIKRLQRKIKPLQQKQQKVIDSYKSLGQEIQNLQKDNDKYIYKSNVVIVKEKLKRYFGIYATKGLVIITDDSTISSLSNKKNTRFIRTDKIYNDIGTPFFKEADDQIKKQISMFIISRIKGLFFHLKSLEKQGLIKSYKDFIMIGFGESGINSNPRFFNILKNDGYNLRIVNDRPFFNICSTCTVNNDKKLNSLYPNFEDIKFVEKNSGSVVCKNYYNSKGINLSNCINFKSKCMDNFPHHDQLLTVQH